MTTPGCYVSAVTTGGKDKLSVFVIKHTHSKTFKKKAPAPLELESTHFLLVES